MYRLILLYALLASCDPANTARLNDEGLMLHDVQQEEMSICTTTSDAITPDADRDEDIPLLRHATMVVAPSLPCATDNPCLVASINQTTGECSLKIVDQQGAVYCDDHNPCTKNDMCYDEYCLGDVIEECDLDDTYYY